MGHLGPHVLALYYDSHGTGRPSDHLNRRIDIVRIEVFHLTLRNLCELSPRDCTDLLTVWLARSFRQTNSFLNQNGSRRRFRYKRERPIRVDRDLDRSRNSLLIGGLRVELLAELHDVDAMRPQRRAYGRGWIGLPTRDMKLDKSDCFFRHNSSVPALISLEIRVIKLDRSRTTKE